MFSADETADVGVDDATPVTEDYKERDNKFTGKIEKMTIDLKSPVATAQVEMERVTERDLALKAARD